MIKELTQKQIKNIFPYIQSDLKLRLKEIPSFGVCLEYLIPRINYWVHIKTLNYEELMVANSFENYNKCLKKWNVERLISYFENK